MFTKIDMHRIERVVSVNPLVTCSFVLSVADNDGELSNVTRFEFHNYNTGQILKVIGGKKKDFLDDLEMMLENRENGIQEIDWQKSTNYSFGERKTEISSTYRGIKHVLTHGTNTTNTTERLKRLVTILNWYMEMRLAWIKEGFFDTSVNLSPDQTKDDAVIRIVRIKDSKNEPLAISLQSHPETGDRVVRLLNGVSSLVLTDYVKGPETTIKKVLVKMSNTLLHILNYDQKSHAIDLFTHLDDVSPEILTYKGYVALSQDAKHRRVAMNFDQNILCSKTHWIHERFYTKAVQEALSDILKYY